MKLIKIYLSIISVLFIVQGKPLYSADNVNPGNPRNFTQTLTMNGSSANLHFHSPIALNLRAPTLRVYVNYRINDSEISVLEMDIETAQQEFDATITGLNDGDRFDYYYTQVLGATYAELPVDSGGIGIK